MSMLSLLPGMEALKRFEDEGDTNINVVVGDPEAAAQAIEDSATETEAATDVAETAAESEAAAEASDTVEELLARLEVHQNYLKKYGYTKEFAMLANYNGFYDKVMEKKYSFPAAESLSVAVNPSDANTQAALEGIGDAVRAVWDWIKDMCSKIAGWFKKIGGFIANLFRTQIGKINHLTTLYKKLDTKKDDDQIKDRKIFTSKDTAKLKTELAVLNCDDLNHNLESLQDGILAITSAVDNPAMEKGWIDDRTKEQRKKANEKIKKSLDEVKSKIKSPDTSLKDCSLQDGLNTLKEATDRCKTYNAMKDVLAIVNKLSSMLDKFSTKQKSIGDPKAEVARNAKNAVSYLLTDQVLVNASISTMNKLVNALIKGAAAIASTYKVSA